MQQLDLKHMEAILHIYSCNPMFTPRKPMFAV